MIDCPRAGKFFGGCRFQARYDETTTPPASPEQITAMTEAFGEPLMDYEVESLTLSSQTYVGDMCVRCGRFSRRA